MRVSSVNSNNSSVPMTPAPAELEQKVEAAKNRVMELQQKKDALLGQIESLKGKCWELKVIPNLAIPFHFGTLISNAPEPLGSLETEIHKLEKDNSYYEIVVEKLTGQIKTAKFDKEVEATKAKIAQSELEVQSLEDEIKALKKQGYRLGSPVIYHGPVIGSSDPEPLRGLKISLNLLQQRIRLLKQERSKLVPPATAQ